MADLSSLSDAELYAQMSDAELEQVLAMEQGGGQAASLVQQPAATFGSEAAAVGGRLASSVGGTLDFINNINPLAMGGPKLWGLNPLRANEPEPGETLTGLAASIGLEGEPQTTGGKLAGGVADYAPDLIFGGGLKGAASVGAAGLSAGLADIFGSGETGQAAAGLVGGIGVPTFGNIIKKLTAGGAKQFQKAALKMGKGTQKQTLKGVGRATRAAILSGEELPVEQVVPIMKERGVLKGSLKPSEMIAKNEDQITKFSEEAGSILKKADDTGTKFKPDDLELNSTLDFLGQHPFEENLATQAEKRAEVIAKEWDGTLSGLNKIKSKLYKVAYATGSDSKQLDRAIGHDLKTFIEQKAGTTLGDDAMEALKTANAKTGEHLQFYDILENVRLEEANVGGAARFLQRAAESPIGLPAFGMAYGALASQPGVMALSTLLAGLGTRRGKFLAADTLNTISKAATPFSGKTIPAIIGTIKQMPTEDFLSAMEEGFGKTFQDSSSDSAGGVAASGLAPKPESELKKKDDIMRQAPKGLPELFEEISAKVGLPASLLQAVAEQESGYDPKANSGKAIGLMQLRPSTAKEQAGKLGLEKYNLEDPADSLLLGGSYLKRMIDMFDGDIKKGLTAYHSGAGNVQRGTLGPIGSVYAQQVLDRLNEG